MVAKVGLLLAAALLAVGPAWADEGEKGGKGGGRGPCREDVRKFCKDAPRGKGRTHLCLKEHESELSEGCRAKLAKRQKRWEEACGADVETHCKGAAPGEATFQCLKQNWDKVSEGCKDLKRKVSRRREGMKRRVKAWREACREDKEKHCKDVKPGGGAIVKCLKEHMGQLSAPCAKAVETGGPGGGGPQGGGSSSDDD